PAGPVQAAVSTGVAATSAKRAAAAPSSMRLASCNIAIRGVVGPAGLHLPTRFHCTVNHLAANPATTVMHFVMHWQASWLFRKEYICTSRERDGRLGGEGDFAARRLKRREAVAFNRAAALPERPTSALVVPCRLATASIQGRGRP